MKASVAPFAERHPHERRIALSMTHPPPAPRSWLAKFADAFRGIRFALGGCSSFHVHVIMAVAVLLSAWLFSVTPLEWCLLILCIGQVMGLEAINSAIETMARVVDRDHNPELGKALDMASGGVLIASIGSAVIGLSIFLPRLWLLLQNAASH